MLGDPPVREDGICARKPDCMKPVPTARKGTQLPRLEQELQAEPFCSSACCRTWHGVKFGTIRTRRAD